MEVREAEEKEEEDEEEEREVVLGKTEKQGRRKGGRGRKVWQRGVIAERIERMQLHLMVGEKGVIAM